MSIYYQDDMVTLHHGDMRDVLPTLGRLDACVADPPYGETSLVWDTWPPAWPSHVADHTDSMWCFGSLRMFLGQYAQFDGWKLSHEVIWEKPVGSAMQADRFKRVHEHILHWYCGRWDALYKDPQREQHHGPNQGVRHGGADRGEHFGKIRARVYEDNGTRLLRSVQRVAHMHGRGIHPTEKPVGILDPLIRYACSPGGVVLDPFAGSCSTLEAARASGRRAVGIEADEAMCEKAARRLSQAVLEVS